MKSPRLVVRVATVSLVIALAVISITGLNLYQYFEQTVFASALTAIPNGSFGSALFKGFAHNNGEGVTIADKYITSNEISVEVGTRRPVSKAIEKTVIGNIIQKTISPYGASQKFSSVYMNNKCGENVDIASELSASLSFSVEKNEQPQILIYHTHATESYLLEDKSVYTEKDNVRTTDNTKNVVAVGEKIAEQLRAAGYSVIHDTTLHDYPGYNGSYTRSAETVKNILKQHPSIKIAIDVHRDSISSGESDKVAPTVTVDGKQAAQVMMVMGSQTGSIKDHPNWRQNLRLALKLQYVLETTYPQLARAISLKSAKYNQNLTAGSILVEMGTDANTLEQALYSGELVGKSLVTLLETQGL